MEKRKHLLSAQDIQHTVKRLSYEILEKNEDVSALCIVGISGRSHQTARLLHGCVCEIAGAAIPYGEVDLERQALRGIPDLHDRVVVLAEDVLFTGDTVRRAMETICGTGRPRRVQLAALIDRGHRRFPIRANFVGKNIPTSTSEFIEVTLDPENPQAGVYICESGEL